MKYFFTLFLLICSLYLSAQKTILWKVTHSNSQKVSYLLGTNHIIGNSFVNAYPIIKEKLNASEVLITETELDKEKMAAYYNAAPVSTELTEIVNGKDVQLIKEVLKKSKVDIFKLTPGVRYITLNTYLPKYKCGNREDSSVFDMYLQEMAKAENKKLVYLETDLFGLDVIKNMTKHFSWKNFKKRIPALLAKYRSTETDGKDCASMKDYTSFNLDYHLEKQCVSDAAKVGYRNENWMKQLPSLLENNNCLVAVGLFHLYNQCGLIERLKKLGYKVETVNITEI